MYCKAYIVIIISVCIITAMHLPLAQSQEKNSNDDVIIIEHSEGDKVNSSGEKVQVFIGNDDKPAVIMKSGGSESVNVGQKESRNNNNSERRAQRKEMREMNQYGGMSSENTRSAEIKKRESEKSKTTEMPFNAENKVASSTALKQEGQIQPPQKPGTIDDKKLQSYMDIIVKKNLFMPLGSGGEAPKPSYALTAVISNTTSKSQPKAIIEQIGSNRGFYVSVGETFADGAKVIEIDERTAKVERSGEELTLSLGFGVQGGGGRGPRGDFREQRGEQRQPGSERRSENRQMRPSMAGDNFDPNKIPPFVRKMLEDRGISIEDLQNNPELREKLRSEFTQRFRGGGTPPEAAPVIIEAPSR